MKDPQLQVAKISISVHHVHLNVRFPCSLTFQLKSENQEIQSQKKHELIKGQCSPFEDLQIETEVLKNQDSQYQEKHIKLVINMNSANGKIPAGSVSIPIGGASILEKQESNSSIEKCPDRTARINYTISTEIIRTLGQIGSLSHHSSTSSAYLKLKNQPKLSSYSKSNMRQSTIKGQSQLKSSLHSGYESSRSGQKPSEKNYSHHINTESNFDRSNRKSRLATSGIFQNNQSNNRKTIDLERQNSAYQQQISHLKNQLTIFRGRDISQDKHSNLLDQINILSNDNQRLKDKIKERQKRQRQLEQQIRDSKQEITRKKQKSNQSQLIRIENQQILESREKLIKQMQVELKRYEEVISDLKISMNTQQKRLDFKEASFKQQIDKLQEKYQQSQSQRLKAVNQMNKMLEQLQNTEKKNQIMIRDKQKTHLQDKNKMKKKIDELLKNNEQYQEKLENDDTLNSDLSREKKLLSSKIKDLEDELRQNMDELQKTGILLTKEKQYTRKLQLELANSEKIESDLKSLQRKYQQLKNSESSKKKLLQSANKQLNLYKSDLKSLQQEASKKTLDLQTSNSTISTLNQQLFALKQEEENYSRQTQTLSIQNIQANTKIEELKNKFEQLQLAYNTLQIETEEQIGYMIKSKQYLESELEENKYNLNKYEDLLDEYERKIKRLNEELFEVNTQVLQAEEKSQKLYHQISEEEGRQKLLEIDNQKLLEKEKINSDKIKKKNEEINECHKKISKLETDYFLLQEKLQHQARELKEKLQKYEITSQTRQASINQIESKNTQITQELANKEQIIYKQEAQIRKLLKENDYLRQNLEQAKNEGKNNIGKNLQYTQKITNLEDLCHEKDIQLINQKQNQQQLSIRYNKLKAEYEANSKQYYEAVKQLLQEISKDIDIKNLQAKQIKILSLPDQKLSLLQVEAIKNRNKVLIKYQQQQANLQHQIKILEEQIQKIKNYNLQREEELQSEIERQKAKIKQLKTNSSVQQEDLSAKLHEQDQKIFQLHSENQQLNLQVNQLKQNLNEVQSAAQQSNFTIQSLQQEVKSLENQLEFLQEDNLKIKNQYENQIYTKVGENDRIVEKLKKIIQQNQKRIVNLEQCNLEKDEQIIENNSQIHQLIYQRDQSQSQYKQIYEIYTQTLQKQRESVEKHSIYDGKIEECENIITKLKGEIVELQKRLQEISFLNNQLQESLSGKEKQKNKLMRELDNVNEQINSLESEGKDTASKNKKISETYLNENKQLREQNISLKSEIELKVFLIQQQQASIKTLKNSNTELTQENGNKKRDNILLNEKIETMNNQKLHLSQNLEAITAEKQSLEQELRIQKQTVFALQDIVNESQTIAEGAAFKDRQIAKLKQDGIQKQKNNEKNVADLKSVIQQSKKQMNLKSVKQEELRKKIRELERQVESRMYDLETEKKNWEEQHEREQIAMSQQLQKYRIQNQTLKEDIATANAEIEDLSLIIAKKNNNLQDNKEEINELKAKIMDLEQQLSSVKQEWRKQKIAYLPTQKQLKNFEAEVIRYQKHAIELQNKNKQLIQIAKKRLRSEETAIKPPAMGQTLRQIQTLLLRSKTKILTKYSSTDRDKQQIMVELRVVQERIESAIKSHHQIPSR